MDIVETSIYPEKVPNGPHTTWRLTKYHELSSGKIIKERKDGHLTILSVDEALFLKRESWDLYDKSTK